MKQAAGVFAAYAAIAVVMTWPLSAGLARDVPGDLGDSLLNMWILGWGAEWLPRALMGQATFSDYWHANIFHPEPLALGFSEHLFGEVLLVAPIYWLTDNLILCYNLLFLSSFALSGLGMFLLARELLQPGGDTPGLSQTHILVAAFIGGLIFAFIPFRVAQIAHIQSLQAQWMPLALYGFRRFIVSGSARALAGGAAALLMQNWSNGYYLVFFAPFVPLFVLHQMWAAKRWRDRRTWFGFIIAGVFVALGTWPFLSLYLETQRVHMFERPYGEVLRYSADVYSYLTAPEALRVWGSVMQAFPKPEGELFFGLVPWLLVLMALLPGLIAGKTRIAVITIMVVLVIQLAVLVAVIFTGGFVTTIAGIPIRATNPARVLVLTSITFAMLIAVSRDVRTRARAWLRSPAFICALCAVLALWLSLGPVPQSQARPLQGLGLYGLLYEHVPGFDGLRVPARYSMIAVVFLSPLAAMGMLRLLRWRSSTMLGAAIAIVFLVEVSFVPMTVNATWGDGGVVPPARVEPAADAPSVYHTLAALSDNTIVAELPFGDPAWELRYVYYSTVHWKRLLNGYSGGFPQGYRTRAALLQRVADNPDAAWRALREAGTTHVVVHTEAFAPGEADTIVKWLDDRFAVEIARFDGTLLYEVAR